MKSLCDLASFQTAANGYVYAKGDGKVYVCGRYNADEAEKVALSVEAPQSEVAKAKNAPRYNLAGQRVGADYKGIVIQGGRKYWQK